MEELKGKAICSEPDMTVLTCPGRGGQWLEVYAADGEYLGTLKIARFEYGKTALTRQFRAGLEAQLDPAPVKIVDNWTDRRID